MTERGRKIPILPPVVDTIPEGMGEIKAAHFILAKAAEQLPQLPREHKTGGDQIMDGALTIGGRGTEHIRWKTPLEMERERLDREIDALIRMRSEGWHDEFQGSKNNRKKYRKVRD